MCVCVLCVCVCVCVCVLVHRCVHGPREQLSEREKKKDITGRIIVKPEKGIR